MDAKALSAEAITFTDMLAKTARLDEPLPVGCDLSESDDKEVQTQVRNNNQLEIGVNIC